MDVLFATSKGGGLPLYASGLEKVREPVYTHSLTRAPQLETMKNKNTGQDGHVPRAGRAQLCAHNHQQQVHAQHLFLPAAQRELCLCRGTCVFARARARCCCPCSPWTNWRPLGRSFTGSGPTRWVSLAMACTCALTRRPSSLG